MACQEKIELYVVDAQPNLTLTVAARVPLVCGDRAEERYTGRVLMTVSGGGDKISLPRYVEGYDLLICRFEVSDGERLLSGVKYVTDFSEDFSACDISEPAMTRPVGTWVTAMEEDMDYLGFGCMMTEINSTWIQTVTPAEDAIPHIWNGKTYYFDQETVALYDRLMEPCIKRGASLERRCSTTYRTRPCPRKHRILPISSAV